MCNKKNIDNKNNLEQIKKTDYILFLIPVMVALIPMLGNILDWFNVSNKKSYINNKCNDFKVYLLNII